MTVMFRLEWYCPNCGKRAHLPAPKPKQIHMHTCPRLRYLSAPLVPVGTAAKVEAIERGDYIGTDNVQLDPERGRPVQSIVTTRDNGQDCVVLAPVAGAEFRVN